jgi:hypothetical protein
MKKILVLFMLLLLVGQSMSAGYLFNEDTITVSLADEESATGDKSELKKQNKEYFCSAAALYVHENIKAHYPHNVHSPLSYVILSLTTPPPDAMM